MGESNFGWALEQLHAGRAIAREGWNGPKQYLRLQVPDAASKNTLPYVWIRTVQGDRVPWLCSQTDMLATDWNIVEEPTPVGTIDGIAPRH